MSDTQPPAVSRVEEGARAFETLLTPASIAVVGASVNPAKLPGRVVPNLLAHGFGGRIYPVNPHTGQVNGITAYAALEDLPEAPDTVLSLVPAQYVLGVLREAARIGAPTATIVASGLGEGSEASRERGRTLAQALAETRIRVLGPNSIGAIDVASGSVQRATVSLPARLVHGPVGVLSHSGAMSLALLHQLQLTGLGCDRVIPLGNEADLSLSDALLNLAGRDQCQCVLMFIEAIKDPVGFAKAAELAHSRGVALVAMCAGTTELARALVAGHTGAVATDRRLQAAFLRDLGVVAARSPRHAVDTARLALRRRRRSPACTLALICVSGGEAAFLADRAQEAGAALAVPRREAERRFASHSRFSEPANPLDMTADALTRPEIIQAAYHLFADDASVDCIGFALSPLMGEDRALVHGAIREIRAADPRVVLSARPAAGPEEGDADFADSEALVDAYGALSAAARLGRPSEVAPRPAAEDAARWEPDQAVRQRLVDAGLRWCREVFVGSAAELESACDSIAPPWVLKGVLEDGAHKARAGAVALELRTREEALTAFRRMHSTARRRRSELRGAWLQETASGAELFVGGLRDRMGAFVGIGLGGGRVDESADVAFASVPAGKRTLRLLLTDRSCSPLPAILRADPSLVEAACEAAMRLQMLFDDQAVRSAELNPLIVGRSGGVVVDARVSRMAKADAP